MASAVGCVKFVRILVIIFNIIFMLFGAALIGLGLWLLLDPDISKVLDLVSSRELFQAAAIVLIVSGGVLFLVSCIGCLGAFFGNKVLLGIFIVILIIVFCLGVAGAVVAIVFKDKLLEELKEILRDTLSDEPYYNGLDSRNVCGATATGELWDFIQIQMECCGIEPEPRTGYEAIPYSFKENCPGPAAGISKPLTCCRPNTNTTKGDIRDAFFSESTRLVEDQRKAIGYFACPAIKTKGCLTEIKSWIGRYSPILIGIGLGVAMLLTIGILLSFCLCVNNKVTGYKRHRDED